MKSFFSGFLLLALLTLTACGGSSIVPPWDNSKRAGVAMKGPSTLDLRNLWLGGAPGQQPPATPQQAAQIQLPPPPMSGMMAQQQEEQVAPQTTPQFADTQTTPMQPVKVALLVPMSGNSAALGESIVNAAQLALFDVGADTFELMPRDTKGTSQGAYAAAQSAIAEGAQLILGPLFAEEVRAVGPLAKSANINMIAFTTDWKQAGGNTFVMGFVPFGQVQRIVSFAASKGMRNIGVIAPQSEYGNAIVTAYNAHAPEAGLQTQDLIRFSPGGAGLGPAIEKFTRYNTRKQPDGTMAPTPFDAVFLAAGGSDAQSVANLLSYYDMDAKSMKRLGTGLWDDAAMARDPNLAGGWYAAPDPKPHHSFDMKYQEAYGATAPRLASLGYDATALAAILARTGIQQSGEPSFDAASIMNPNGFSGIDGIFRFRPDGLAERGLAVLELRNGQSVVIDPAPWTFQNTGSQ